MTTAEICDNPSWKNHELVKVTVGRSLSALAETVAKNELQEEEETKSQALREFREWILRNSGLVNVRTDDSFLLRFLRAKKWSVALAEHTLVKYLNFKQSVPQFAFRLDCDEAKVAELIHSGYLFPSPIRDSMGRKVIIGLASKLDISRFSNIHMAKVHAITYETLLEDEENQVLGFVHFGDLKGLHLGHLSLFSPAEFAMCMRVGEQAYPMRHKSVHFLNMNPTFKYAYEFFSTRFSEKMRTRLMVHDNLKQLQNHIERKCLPKEYGGDIPMSDMIVTWQTDLSNKRQAMLSLDKMKSLIPIRRKKENSHVEELRGSFKKLQFD